jgi:hypothetical protein
VRATLCKYATYVTTGGVKPGHSGVSIARENYELLKANPRHPSLHLKKARGYWSVRIGRGYRAPGKDFDGGILGGWTGAHGEYVRLLSS